MGSPFNLIIVSDDSAIASQLAKQSFELIDFYSRIYSDYDASSELSKLSVEANQGYKNCSPELWDILWQSKQAYENSYHSFDISIGALSSFWRQYRKQKSFPDSNLIVARLKQVGLNQIRWDSVAHKIYNPIQGLKFDLGGIAKGYIAQKVIDFLKSKGIPAALADAGGDIVMSNGDASSHGWIVGINIPETTDDLLKNKLLLQNCAVATSGDAYQYIEHLGKKYSHIIDPRTGYGVNFQRNVTIIARDGTIADWLATACSIVTIKEAKSICKKFHADFFISSIEQGKLKVYQTKGFQKYWQQEKK